MKKPLILITNDDGVNSPGITFLINIMKDYGDVVVVAPDKPRSGFGHAITLDNSIRYNEVSSENNLCKKYSCTGTPADCVKLAINKILDKKPDLCVSGINHGSNSSINVVYSGTMSAAVEATIHDIPSIGFSLLDYSKNADFSESDKYIRKIIKYILFNGIQVGTALNVNIPKRLKTKKIKGIKVCRQAKALWKEDFKKQIDQMGNEYYCLGGKFVNMDHNNDTDEWALSNHYVSIVPVNIDHTCYESINILKNNLNES